MMSSTENTLPPSPGRSWRTIRQEVQPLAMSRKGRRRQLLAWTKIFTFITVVIGLGWGLFAVGYSWATDRASLATAVHSAPVGRVALITDGVLTQKWTAETLALPKGTSLMALDLPALRDKLLAHGQVRVAVLTRNFPATLVVTLQERTPVARVRADTGLGEAQSLLVAKDGVVYPGINYDPTMLASLPWLDGIRLVRSGHGFEPISGMKEVSDLLSTAQLQAPHLYRGWLIVSLARLATTDELLVKSQDIPEIVFTRKRAFFKQIAQLDYIIDRAHALPDPVLKSVNLTLEGQVPVVLETAATDVVPPKAPPTNFLLQPSQRKVSRDF